MCFILLSYVDETNKFSVDVEKTGPGARGQRLLLGAELRRSLPKINMMRGFKLRKFSHNKCHFDHFEITYKYLLKL